MRPKSSARRRPRRPRKKKSTRRPRTAYLGLGSNLGEGARNLREALGRISLGAKVLRVSSLYRSEPVGHADQPSFWNAVAEISWSGTPAALLRLARKIEEELGRVPTFRNGPRVIDVDLLDLEGIRRKGPDPILPHPRLPDRRFVLAPLAEIAPAWRHPVTGQTVKEMLTMLPRRPWVRRISGPSLRVSSRRSSSIPRGCGGPVPGARGLPPDARARARTRGSPPRA